MPKKVLEIIGYRFTSALQSQNFFRLIQIECAEIVFVCFFATHFLRIPINRLQINNENVIVNMCVRRIEIVYSIWLITKARF